MLDIIYQNGKRLTTQSAVMDGVKKMESNFGNVSILGEKIGENRDILEF